MEVWKIIFLSKGVICRFHVNLPGCNSKTNVRPCVPQPIVLLVRSITFTKFYEGLGKGCAYLHWFSAKTVGLGAILFFGLLFGTHQHVDN